MKYIIKAGFDEAENYEQQALYLVADLEDYVSQNRDENLVTKMAIRPHILRFLAFHISTKIFP